MKLSLYYPAKPWKITQPWGVTNYQYLIFGFTQHNGVDSSISWDGIVRAEIPCEVIETGYKAGGAGNYVSVITNDKYESPFGEAFVRIDYMHLKNTLGMYKGKKLTVGDQIAPQNNTGFSTGPHTHYQHRWVAKGPNDLIDLEKNGANNSFNPEPFRNGTYAEDVLRERLKLEINTLQRKIIELTSLYIKRLQARLDWTMKN